MQYQGRAMGSVEVICGPMFSGKTEELMRRLRLATIARQRVQIFKHISDDRYDETALASHDDSRFQCKPVKTSHDILKCLKDHTRVVGIDEAQFFDDGIADVCQKLADRGIRVIVAGLDQTYQGEPFGSMPLLLAIADFVSKNQAVCMSCGGVGTKTQRLIRKSDKVIVGTAAIYEARCRSCFDPDFSIAEGVSSAAGHTKECHAG